MENKTRSILIAYALKYKGHWKEIFEAIQKQENIDEFLEEAEKTQAITIFDEDYPQILKNVLHPPFVLFYKGNRSLLNEYKHKVAFSGARNKVDEMAINLITDKIKENEFIVVSGMARGTDEKVLENVIFHNVIGVLGCGINKVYPQCMVGEYDNVASNGLLISEYPNNCEPESENFIMRNRIIAALSDSVIAINKVSTTIGFALSLHKTVYAVPHSFEDCETNQLILDGAIPLLSEKQINEFGKE